MTGWSRNSSVGGAPLWLAALSAALPGNAALAQEPHYGLEEITVTARRRAESLQQTPVAVTAFSQADIEARKLTDISQIAHFTPNVEFDFTAPISGSTNNASIFIRGVGQTDFVPQKDPGVGVYLDGVYITRTVGSVLNLLDVERVEVLRGPQGTLFGKNTIGGAINVVTVKPQAELAGELDLTVGSFDRLDFRGWANLPISDRLFSRWSLGAFNRDGYMRRIEAGDHEVTAFAVFGHALVGALGIAPEGHTGFCTW